VKKKAYGNWKTRGPEKEHFRRLALEKSIVLLKNSGMSGDGKTDCGIPFEKPELHDVAKARCNMMP
jgi:hypothetical protein